MASILSRLHPAPGSTAVKTRVGRGRGSGLGKTSGRGQKGQKSRTSGLDKRGFEGGQMPLQRRLPKRGFFNPFARKVAIVSVGQLERFPKGTKVDVAALRAAGLVRRGADFIKVLGGGEIPHALHVEVHAVTPSAKAKIEKAGGTAVSLVPPHVRKPPPQPKPRPVEVAPAPDAKAAPKAKGGDKPKGEKPAKEGGEKAPKPPPAAKKPAEGPKEGA